MLRQFVTLSCLLFLATWPAHGADEAAPESVEPPPAVVKTVALEKAELSQVVSGIATILSPDTLIALDAEIRAADIAATFSERELARYKSTKSLSLHIVEGAQREAETAAAKLAALKLQLKQTWGETSPFIKDESRHTHVQSLSAGKTVLARLDFPAPQATEPRNIRVAPLSGGGEVPVNTLWAAPSGSAAMPGISYFGMIEPGPGLRHQDRARAVGNSGVAQTGVVIPEAALVVYGGETWCYVETAPQTFERRKVPLTMPVPAGYLVEAGFDPGTKVVVRGASTLLSREAEPGDDGDGDDDGGGAERPRKQPKAESAPPVANKSRDRDADDRPAQAEAGNDGAASADTKPNTAAAARDDDKAAEPKTPAAKGKASDPAPDDDDEKAAEKKPKKPATASGPVTGSTSPSRAE